MCQIILNCDIALPEGSSAEDYWEAVLKDAVNNKYSFNKSNLIEALKKQYEGNRPTVELDHFSINLQTT